MARPLRIVFYAVNGTGLGHITRQVAIARWVRRYLAALGRRAEIWFLTSSEADSWLFEEGFAAFKIPSKTIAAESGLDHRTFLALAKQWVWHSLALVRPDLFVVDTFPRGSFGELLSTLDLCERRAFVFRPVRESFGRRPDFQAMLPLYDLLLVPEHASEMEALVPDGAKEKLRHTGPVLLRERAELLSRVEARAVLGVPEDALAVCVTGGGGGDPRAEERLAASIDEARRLPNAHVVVAPGPLYRGSVRHGPDVTWLGPRRLAELWPAFDLAIAAAGYNTFAEICFAGVPAIYWPQPKVADEQRQRAERAEREGAARLLAEDAGGHDLREALAELVDPERRAAMAEAARRVVPENAARHAAAALLELVLPAFEVDLAEEIVGDAWIRAARALGASDARLADVIRALDPRSKEDPSRRDPASFGRAFSSLLEAIAALAVPLDLAVRIVADVSRRLSVLSPGERATGAESLLRALASFGDYRAGALFAHALPAGPDAVSTGLSVLALAESRGADLYGALADLVGRPARAAEETDGGAEA